MARVVCCCCVVVFFKTETKILRDSLEYRKVSPQNKILRSCPFGLFWRDLFPLDYFIPIGTLKKCQLVFPCCIFDDDSRIPVPFEPFLFRFLGRGTGCARAIIGHWRLKDTPIRGIALEKCLFSSDTQDINMSFGCQIMKNEMMLKGSAF